MEVINDVLCEISYPTWISSVPHILQTTAVLCQIVVGAIENHKIEIGLLSSRLSHTITLSG